MPEWRKLFRDISDSKKLPRLNSDSPRLLWTWMIPYTDCEGRILADPNYIKGKVVPRLQDWDVKKVSECLSELDTIGLIQIYEAGGETYAQFEQPQFDDHQNIGKKEDGSPKKEAPCKIPVPPPQDSRPTTELVKSNSGVTPARLDKIRLDKRRGESSSRPTPELLPTNSGVTPDLLEHPFDDLNFNEIKKMSINIWNQFAKPHNLKGILSIAKGSKREKHFRARCKEKDFNFPKILSLAEGMDFCFGNNDRGWKISFDWIVENSGNYIQILEEKYLDDDQKQREFKLKEKEDDPY